MVLFLSLSHSKVVVERGPLSLSKVVVESGFLFLVRFIGKHINLSHSNYDEEC